MSKLEVQFDVTTNTSTLLQLLRKVWALEPDMVEVIPGIYAEIERLEYVHQFFIPGEGMEPPKIQEWEP